MYSKLESDFPATAVGVAYSIARGRQQMTAFDATATIQRRGGTKFISSEITCAELFD